LIQTKKQTNTKTKKTTTKKNNVSTTTLTSGLGAKSLFFLGGEFFSKFWSDLDELWLTHPPQVTVSSWARQSLAPQICSAKGIDPVLKMLISSFIFVWCLKYIYLSMHLLNLINWQ
jgi:hypothetical protein